MQKGEGQFDTKRWGKVSVRAAAAAARGCLLKSAAKLCLSGKSNSFNDEQVQTLKSMADQLADEADELARRILRYNLREAAEKPHKKRKGQIPTSSSSIQYGTVRGQLKTAISKVRKTSRDVPLMLEQLGEVPTVQQAAHTLVEVGRIINGVPLFLAALEGTRTRGNGVASTVSNEDPWGIGREYAPAQLGLHERVRPTRRIVTHRKPDADALVAAWIAERHLFPTDACQIKFVDRMFDPSADQHYDCVVDVGRVCNPDRRIFDHKPPAFIDRNQTCAAKLVWQHVCESRRPAHDLADLIELVHDGDAIARRSGSASYAESRKTGLHALIKHAQGYCDSDQMLYQAIKVYLDIMAVNTVFQTLD